MNGEATRRLSQPDCSAEEGAPIARYWHTRTIQKVASVKPFCMGSPESNSSISLQSGTSERSAQQTDPRTNNRRTSSRPNSRRTSQLLLVRPLIPSVYRNQIANTRLLQVNNFLSIRHVGFLLLLCILLALGSWVWKQKTILLLLNPMWK